MFNTATSTSNQSVVSNSSASTFVTSQLQTMPTVKIEQKPQLQTVKVEQKPLLQTIKVEPTQTVLHTPQSMQPTIKVIKSESGVSPPVLSTLPQQTDILSKYIKPLRQQLVLLHKDFKL